MATKRSLICSSLLYTFQPEAKKRKVDPLAEMGIQGKVERKVLVHNMNISGYVLRLSEVLGIGFSLLPRFEGDVSTIWSCT